MARLTNPRPHGFPDHIYCDESLNRGDFDLIGGLWLTNANARRLREILAGLREAHGHDQEFKWKKASGVELSPVYRDLAQKLTDQLVSGRASFHCLVLTRRQIDYKTFHDGDHELGYYKFVELLVRKRVRPGRSYLLHLDYRTNRDCDRLPTLKRVLNATARRDLGLAYDCCRDVQAKDSKKDDLLQATDILLGAVGWHYAGCHRDPSRSMAKNDLAARIARGIGRPNLAFESSPLEANFNIWKWKPSVARK